MATGAGLFCVELRSADWERMVGWYRDVLGLRCLLRVVDDRYALLGNNLGRLAILGRDEPVPGSRRWSLAVEVDDVPAVLRRAAALGTPTGAATLNAEGFHEATLADPDGNRLRVFAWHDNR